MNFVWMCFFIEQNHIENEYKISSIVFVKR